MAKSPRSRSDTDRHRDALNDAFQAISKRRLDLLAERWRGYLPADIEDMPEAFQPPAEDEVVIDRFNRIASEDRFETIEDAPIIRTLVFEASRFCSDRCLYFTRSAERLAHNGAPTAALTAAYLAMMFGARSVQSLLGIYYCFSSDRTWVLDIWPDASETSSGGRTRDWMPSSFGLISKRRMGHEHHWKLFIRLRAITTRLPVEDGALAILRKLKTHGDYSTQRNDIQYNDVWHYGDLYGELTSLDIGLLPPNWDVNLSDLDCNLKVAQIFAFCSVAMLLSVLKPLPKFKGFVERLRGRLNREWHPVMNRGALHTALSELERG
ncbi:MAG: hypothetical protein WB760_25580 [Xanthobacteraceae bacterium]